MRLIINTDIRIIGDLRISLSILDDDCFAVKDTILDDSRNRIGILTFHMCRIFSCHCYFLSINLDIPVSSDIRAPGMNFYLTGLNIEDVIHLICHNDTFCGVGRIDYREALGYCPYNFLANVAYFLIYFLFGIRCVRIDGRYYRADGRAADLTCPLKRSQTG